MSKVLDFYCESGTDPYGRTFDDMITLNDAQLEASHDVIQWLFPLHEESNFNEDAPLIDEDSSKILRQHPTAQARIDAALRRFAVFLGFTEEAEEFYRVASFPRRSKYWLRRHDHNHLRITRVIRSLRLFGLEALALKFFQAVMKVASDSGIISATTQGYWKKALEGEVFQSLR